MKVVILAGGYGTRISEESYLKPKPMIGLGEKPILWHIMKIYSAYGYNDFILCLGYKQHIIKEFFSNYFLYNSDVTLDLVKNEMQVHGNYSEDWKVTLVDTGLETMTGGRIKRVQKYIGDEPFMVTYGDGVADINISKLVEFHKSHGKIGTITTVNAGQRFGVVKVEDDGSISSFREKQEKDGSLINGGFMVMNPEIFKYIEGDTTIFEQEPLETISRLGQLKAYRHEGFWHCMDTQRDKKELETMWLSGEAPWKIW